MKTYLGDGVYLEDEGWHLKLTSENGVQVLDTIFLEPDVMLALAKQIREKLGHEQFDRLVK